MNSGKETLNNRPKESAVSSDVIKIALDENQPSVIGIPEGNTILFFGKINDEEGYCIIYGPTDSCLPKDGFDHRELWHAKVAIGRQDQPLEVHQIRHGHKYGQGGGMIQFGKEPVIDLKQIFFRLIDNSKKSTYYNPKLGKTIEIEKVYSAI